MAGVCDTSQLKVQSGHVPLRFEVSSSVLVLFQFNSELLTQASSCCFTCWSRLRFITKVHNEVCIRTVRAFTDLVKYLE